MRRGGFGFVDDAADFGDFVHQVHLGWQTTGGIGQNHVDATGLGRMNRVKNDGRRVAPFLGDDGDIVAVRPHACSLFAGGCAEGIAGGQ